MSHPVLGRSDWSEGASGCRGKYGQILCWVRRRPVSGRQYVCPLVQVPGGAESLKGGAADPNHLGWFFADTDKRMPHLAV